MDNYKIYIHLNKSNGKVYIGQTKQDLEARWKNGNGYKACPRFYRAILKYGWDGFHHLLIQDNLSKEEADLLEKELIEEYNALEYEYGYNISEGGYGDPRKGKTEEELAEWREKRLQTILERGSYKGERNPMYGKTHSEESKRKMSESSKGYTPTVETLQKLSEASKGVNNPSARAVRCINTNETFEYGKLACEKYGLDLSYLIKCCKGKARTHGQDPITGERLRWEYA